MDRVSIGVDPRKLSVTIEARDTREILRATGQFGTDTRSYHQLLKVARQWPQRIWAVEGANGVGCPLARRFLADNAFRQEIRSQVQRGRLLNDFRIADAGQRGKAGLVTPRERSLIKAWVNARRRRDVGPNPFIERIQQRPQLRAVVARIEQVLADAQPALKKLDQAQESDQAHQTDI